MLFRQAVDPLGSFDRAVKPAVALVLGTLAVLAATALLELSRTLAETYRGPLVRRNGRDVFHAAAALVLATALLANGLPPALAALRRRRAADPAIALPGFAVRAAPAPGAMIFALVGIGRCHPSSSRARSWTPPTRLARLLFY